MVPAVVAKRLVMQIQTLFDSHADSPGHNAVAMLETKQLWLMPFLSSPLTVRLHRSTVIALLSLSSFFSSSHL